MAEYIEKDSEMSSNISFDNSIHLDSSTKSKSCDKAEEKKRKVKRVDYTLKLTSNDIERKQPVREGRYKKPTNYKVQMSKEKRLSDNGRNFQTDFSK